MLTVIQSACRAYTEGGTEIIITMPRPNRHSHIIKAMHDLNEGFGRRCPPEDTGFLLSDGTFADRTAAMIIANEAGQNIRDDDPTHYQGDELYSEDLY